MKIALSAAVPVLLALLTTAAPLGAAPAAQAAAGPALSTWVDAAAPQVAKKAKAARKATKGKKARARNR